MSLIISLYLGEIYGCGNNVHGALGADVFVKASSSLVPASLVNINPGDLIINIDAGTSHSVAITTAGLVYTWGLNTNHALAQCSQKNAIQLGAIVYVPTPICAEVELVSRSVQSIAAGYTSTYLGSGS
jgi:alpha-tubulin suppressor-like RCC1 family protein